MANMNVELSKDEIAERRETLASNGMTLERAKIKTPGGHVLGGWQVTRSGKVVAESEDELRAINTAYGSIFELKKLTPKYEHILATLFDQRQEIADREEAAYLERVRQGGDTRRDLSDQSPEADLAYANLASALSILADDGYDLSQVHSTETPREKRLKEGRAAAIADHAKSQREFAESRRTLPLMPGMDGYKG